MKKRANSKKEIKIEHVSEATAGQWDLSGPGGGRVDRGNPTPISLPPPCPTHTIAKKRNLTCDWPSPAWGRQGNEALLGQRTEQTPGLQRAAGVQEKERGRGGPAAAQGRGFPSECVHAAFGGPGAPSPSAPSPDRAFCSSWRWQHGQGEERPPSCHPCRAEAHPVQPTGHNALGACGFVLSFW